MVFGVWYDCFFVLVLIVGVAMNETRTPERRAGARVVLVEFVADVFPFDVVELKFCFLVVLVGVVSRTVLVNRFRVDFGV